MSDKDLEQRVTRLERELADLEARHLTHKRDIHGSRIAELATKIENLEARTADIDKIEELAHHAYLQSNPEALKAMLDADSIICTGLNDHQFQNIPSIKDYKRRS